MFLGRPAVRAQSSDGSGDEDGSNQDSESDDGSEQQSDDEQQSDAGSGAAHGDDSDADEPTTSKKARKEDKKNATDAATSLPPNVQLRKELDLHKLDKQGRNFVHYMVDPNAWENVELLRTIIAAASGAKQLLTKPDKYGRTPADIAVDTYQKRMCTEIQKMTVTFRPKPKPRSEAPLPQTQHRVDDDSKAFLRQQEELGKGKALPKDERKPHRNSGYATTGEIVVRNDKLYKVLLHKTELLAFGYNGFHNYYRMELIQRRGSELFILFTNWGRIGDPTGQYQRTPFGSFEEADKEFKSVFRQKTGNNWDDAFEEKENKYRIVSVEDGSSDEISELEIELEPKEYLSVDRNDLSPDKVVYETIKDISSAKRLQERSRAVSSYKTRLPFGRLKAEDLLKAKEILGDLQKLIADLEKVSNDDKQAQADKTKDRLRISRQQAEVSNKFYRVMPLGGFENCALPVIEDERTLKDFSKIIEQMLEYEVAGQLVTAAAFRQPQIDPYIQSALECDLKLLDADGAEAQHILQYIQNSSRVRVSAIFSVNSKASTQLFSQKHPTLWPTSENHWYLWHGTKPENLLSILKRGLLVAPSSALHTGHAYGEGVYFSDMFTKSEAYCTQSEDGFKYATLCEVDLTGMYCSKEYMPNIDEDPKARASSCVKVYGRQRPNPAFGKTMPTGRPW
ncbi:CBN-PME-5 protein [Aphelenchoides avenae]|nr:CBN-PME-5 protein [Aphelenchus avenae]